MDLFCFASRNEENIYRGVEAKTWAVATVSASAMKSRSTKAQKYLKPGARGILYCNPRHAFTVPFVVASIVDPIKVVDDIWPEPWVLPFRIEPLGSLSKMISKESAQLRWPILQHRAHYLNVTAAMNLTGTTVFVPIDIGDADWEIILSDLAH